MNPLLRIMTAVASILICVSLCFAQAHPPAAPPSAPPNPPPEAPLEKAVGRAKAYYSASTDTIDAFVTVGDIGKESRRSENDSLWMMASFTLTGKKLRPPEYVLFDFDSHSEQFQYKADNKLTIFLDGIEFLSGNTRIVVSESKLGKAHEGMRSPRLEYKYFLQMLDAKKVEIQLGPTRFELKKEEIEALRDLKRIVEQ